MLELERAVGRDEIRTSGRRPIWNWAPEWLTVLGRRACQSE